MLTAGLCFNIPKDNPLHLWLLATFVFLFTALYSPGAGPVPFTYAAEAFPISHREVGMSLAVSTSAGFASAVSLTFPRLLAILKPQGAFGLYAGLNLVALVLLFLFLPETKQKTLEELDDVFAIPTVAFAKHEVTQTLPWFFQRYFLGKRDVEWKPLVVRGYQEVLSINY